ncbi:MAG: hypothetical protein AAGA65_21505 [Actinomycetota bacterium]
MTEPADESRRTPDGPEWSESHRLLALSEDGTVAVAMEVGIHHRPGSRWGSFHCAVFRDGLLPVVIAENDMPVPARLWEFRTSGLWVDNVCERPRVHWSYGLEAFGLAIDDPQELLGRGYGDRVPLGWELDFESSPELYHDGRQVGRLDGELLFAGGEQPISGPAVRRHQWGPPTDPLVDSGVTAVTGSVSAGGDPLEVALPTREAVWWVTRTGVGLDCRTGPLPEDQR